MKSKRNLSSYFDAKKGQSIIRMMSKIIGEKTFFKGLRLYLKRHQFGNAEVNDLWIALEQVSKKPIGEIMNSWVHQKNYPLVVVTKSQSQFCLKVSQKAFVINVQLFEKNQKLKWHLPIVYKTASDNQMIWMLLSNMIGYICERDEIILNYGAFCFYRTKYTLKMYKKKLYMSW
ncbi:uncharacterized protein B4U79_17050 [Dinothrombium tinctorium]|uniref:Peptidase M1 membrane alanine aminopeptidase domain-containing protein n=1 Tax=Dinothrombium tinctorium TaxID=1965070 RepID=A0A3S3NV55_9ACAR|nr:uncharacterized protein B4U79_17050 [Dinothrombium tinctorium]